MFKQPLDFSSYYFSQKLIDIGKIVFAPIEVKAWDVLIPLAIALHGCLVSRELCI